MISSRRSFLTSIFRSETALKNAFRFDTDVEILGQNRAFKEYSPALAAQLSPLANQLFNSFTTIDKILLGPSSVVTVLKSPAEINQIQSKLVELLDQKVPAQKAANFSSEQEVIEALGKLDKSTPEERIEMLLEVAIRPALRADKGDCDLIEFKNGVVRIELKGNCKGCPSAKDTMKGFVEKLMRQYIPEVQSVEEVK